MATETLSLMDNSSILQSRDVRVGHVKGQVGHLAHHYYIIKNMPCCVAFSVFFKIVYYRVYQKKFTVGKFSLN